MIIPLPPLSTESSLKHQIQCLLSKGVKGTPCPGDQLQSESHSFVLNYQNETRLTKTTLYV